MRHAAPTPRVRFVSLALCCLLAAAPALLTPEGFATGEHMRTVSPPPAPPTRSAQLTAAAANLPNLDEARQHVPAEPVAPPPIPSTLRRCPPSNPRCNEPSGGLPGPLPTPTGVPTPHPLPLPSPVQTPPVIVPTPTPSPSPSPSPSATPGLAARGGASPERFLASLAALPLTAAAALTGARPSFDVPALDYFLGDGGHAVSDARAGSPLLARGPAAAAAAAQTSPALALHWKFDDGAGTAAADSSGHGNTGSVQGPTWDAGNVGTGGLNFDGADSVTAIDSQSFAAVSDSFTLSFWVYPRATHQIDAESTSGLAGTSGQRYVIRPWFEPGTEAGAGVSVGTNGVSVYEHGSGYMPATLVHQASITGWTHVAVVYENKQPKLYLNGTLVRTGLTSPRSHVRPRPRVVGGADNDFYDGRLDDLRLYDGAFSSAAIAALADPPAQLVAHWKFDEGSGAAAADATGKGNNGTVSGASWAAGKVIGALGFDGADDRVAVTNSSALTAVANSFTISFWAFPQEAHQIDAEDTSGIGGTSGQRYALRPLYQPPGDAGVGVSVGTNGVSVYESSSGYMPATLVHQASITDWTHVAVVYENKRPTLYLNGSPVRTGLMSPRANVRAGTSGLGGAENDFYAGRLDDVRVYKGALTAGEVPALAAGAGTGLTARYYDNVDLTDHKLTRTDAAVNFAWDLAAPAPGLGAEEFSVSWSGKVVPRYTETYTFKTRTDDGVRLWVDGQLLIDKWVDQEPTDWAGQIALQAGRAYDIRMEFYDRFWGATAILNWSSASQVEEFVPQSRLYGDAPGGEENGSAYNFSAARLDPVNRTGATDPYSRNHHWSVPVVSLPGRAGHDLSLALSYNSLVWTRDGGGVTFDADRGFPGPGFRLGFPVIQPRFYNPRTQKYAYLLLTPSGHRVELRQVGASSVYEAADSSYLRLEAAGGALTLLTTDGTRLDFSPLGGEYQCTRLLDRNGNYITASYHAGGQLATVVDTLGRTITFNYDANGNLLSITQPQKREKLNGQSVEVVEETRQWATFGYGPALTLAPNAALFGDLAVVGTQGGTALPVLRQVGLPDGSYYRFEYNGWGQVYKITHHAADSVDAGGNPNFSHPLNSTWLDLPGAEQSLGGAGAVAATPQADCPRFTQSRVWIENGVGGVNAETLTGYGEWSAGLASCEVTPPDATPGVPNDGVVYKHTYGTGWQRGLTTRSEVVVGGQVSKTTTFKWKHDGVEGDADPTNPRVEETVVSDAAGNARMTRVEYTPAAEFRLPKKVEECDDDCSQVLRTTVTEYDIPDLGQYTSRRIIGLPHITKLYQGTVSEANLRAQVEYVYDAQNTATEPFLAGLPNGAQATAHEQGYDDADFKWRGNLNRVLRHEVDQEDGTTSGAYTESRTGYHVTGTVAYTKDAAGHTTALAYADAFFDGVNRNTFAYPTLLTDPDGYTSASWYNYDMGAVTKTRTPQPNTVANQPGPEGRRFYDRAGRAQKVWNVVTGAHTEWVYPPSLTLVQSYTTVKDESLTDPSLRAYAATVFDGAGRVRGTAQDLPVPDATGRYAGVRVLYDVLGRAEYQSNPTEMTTTGGAWTPAGDDANGGAWRLVRQQYDWQGRPTVTTNVDGTTREVLYGGCGCAGGAVVTTRDEVGRRQKVTFDVFGRVWKSQVLTIQPKADPLTHGIDADVYSTTTNTFNARDQLVQVVEQAGAAGAAQTTTMEYDGYGRPWRKHAPEQDAGRFGSYTYTPDDMVETFTDARGAKTVYGYNARHLTTSVSYDTTGVVAGQNVAAAAGATFQYYADGARKLMDDGPGSVEYAYDQLGRLETEKRYFEALGTNPYQITYGYTLTGALKSVKDPWDAQIDYGLDRVGRLTSVTGTAFGGVTQYVAGTQGADGVLYRAWGGVKHIAYGNTKTLDITYNSRLQPETLAVPGLMSKRYEYHADGQLRYTQDQLDPRFDRSYSYDLAGRLSAGYSGPAARGEADTSNRPYHQTYQYDVWGNLTSRTTLHWSNTAAPGYPEPQTYVNNRGVALGVDNTPVWKYNADGRIIDSHDVQYTYDGAGRKIRSVSADKDIQQTYDGSGRRAKATEATTYYPESGTYTETVHTYLIYSSVLGDLLSEMGDAGQKRRTFVYAGGGVLAWQMKSAQGAESVKWEHRDTSHASFRVTTSTGANSTPDRAELDPLGSDSGVVNPNSGGGGLLSKMVSEYPSFGSSHNSGKSRCYVHGFEQPCEYALWQVETGKADFCPKNNCGPKVVKEKETGKERLVPFGWDNRTGQFGYAGWVEVEDGRDLGVIRIDPKTGEPTYGHDQNRRRWGVLPAEEGELPFEFMGFGFMLAFVPQVSIPKVANASPDQQQRFADAYKEALKRLGDKNSKCADLFGGAKRAVKALKEIKYAVGPTVNPAALAQISGKTLTINPGNEFFATGGGVELQVGLGPKVNREGYFINLGNVELAALILLHELGHRTGNLESDGDDPFGIRSVINNGKVKTACFNEVKHYLAPLPAR